MNENQLFKTYVEFELLYETKLKKKNSLEELYPKKWYRIYDYQLKIDILKEALDNNVLIIDTSKYQMPQEKE